MIDNETGIEFEPFNRRDMPENKPQKTLNVDFDGTLCDGEYINENTIIGKPLMTDYAVNTISWLGMMINEGIQVNIFSCRNFHTHGVELIKSWLKNNGMNDEYIYKIGFPTKKPYGVFIDDNDVQALKYGIYFPTLAEVKKFLEC
jgi:hypothetical protein